MNGIQRKNLQEVFILTQLSETVKPSMKHVHSSEFVITGFRYFLVKLQVIIQL